MPLVSQKLLNIVLASLCLGVLVLALSLRAHSNIAWGIAFDQSERADIAEHRYQQLWHLCNFVKGFNEYKRTNTCPVQDDVRQEK